MESVKKSSEYKIDSQSREEVHRKRKLAQKRSNETRKAVQKETISIRKYRKLLENKSRDLKRVIRNLRNTGIPESTIFKIVEGHRYYEQIQEYQFEIDRLLDEKHSKIRKIHESRK